MIRYAVMLSRNAGLIPVEESAESPNISTKALCTMITR